MGRVVKLPAKRGFREVHPAVRQINDFAHRVGVEGRNYATALVAVKRAIAITPNSRELWSNLGSYFFELREYAEAEAALMRALAIDPKYATAHCNLALVYGATCRYDEAFAHYEIAERIEPTYLAVQWDRSLLRIKRGDFKKGFEEYESRIAYRKEKGKSVYPTPPAPWYNGEPLRGKTVYVIGEQGIGDTILFSRFLPWLTTQGCEKIWICVGLNVVALLWEFRGVSPTIEFLPVGVPIPKADYSIAMGSLPHWSGATLEKLPPDPGLISKRVVECAKDNPFELPNPLDPDPFRVGVCWRGNAAQARDEERSVPFREMLRVVENPRVWAFSFQVGEAVGDIAKADAGELVCDLSAALMNGGLVACGAALLRMDLVITSCTMLAHLAGVLGVPCWTLLCYDHYWPWLTERTDSPWYPKTRLFRQSVPDNWHWVMNDVVKELGQLDQLRATKKEKKNG